MVLQITDNHIYAEAEASNKGYAPAASLAAVLAAAARRRPRPQALLFTGDVSNDDTEGSYARFVAAVQRAWPHLRQHRGAAAAAAAAAGGEGAQTAVLFTPGNHLVANYAAMREAFGAAGWQGPSVDDEDRILSVQLCEGWRCVLLDSTVPASQSNEAGKAVHGEIDAAQVMALRGELALAEVEGERVLVVMHHPMRAPTTEAESVWSRVCLRGEVAALLQRAVADSPAVAAVLTGHLHSEMDERVGNARLLAAPSTCHQYLQEGERIRLAEDDTSGFREIVLKSDGRWTTEVVRLGAAADAAARVSTPPATA